MARGGYQKPSQPAPVSGPGAMSARTDKGQPVRAIPDAEYGEQAEYQSLQQAAPLAQSQDQIQVPVSAGLPQLVPMDAPSQRPGEPVTAGSNAGPGPDMNALGLPDPRKQDLTSMAPLMASIELMANGPTSGPEFRQFARKLRANMSDY
jgi:hypothetical protein